MKVVETTNFQQPRCPPTDEWMKNLWHIYNGTLLSHKKEHVWVGWTEVDEHRTVIRNEVFFHSRVMSHVAFWGAFLVVERVKSASNAGDLGPTPWSGRCPGDGNGSPPQHSCLGHPWMEVPGGPHSSPRGRRVRQGVVYTLTFTPWYGRNQHDVGKQFFSH